MRECYSPEYTLKSKKKASKKGILFKFVIHLYNSNLMSISVDRVRKTLINRKNQNYGFSEYNYRDLITDRF